MTATLHRRAQDTDAGAIRASRSQPAAFRVVFDRHFAAIHRYLAGRVGVDLADELAAETFAIASRKRDGYDDERVGARPWLYGIAANLLGRHRRREERELRAYARTGRDPAVDHGADMAAAADARAAGPALAAAVAGLHQDRKSVV